MKVVYALVDYCKECPYFRKIFDNEGVKFICNKYMIYLKEFELNKISEFCNLPDREHVDNDIENK